MAEVQFRLEAEKKVEAIKQALANQLSVMSLVKAFYAGSVEVDRNEFKIFSDSVFEETSRYQNIGLDAACPIGTNGVHLRKP